MSKAAVQLRGVHKTYRMGRFALHVLRGVSFEIAAGEFVAIVSEKFDGNALVDGFAPFCKHLFLPNFTAAAVQAVHDTLKALREGTPPKELTGVASAETIKRLTRDADYRRWTSEFLDKG